MLALPCVGLFYFKERVMKFEDYKKRKDFKLTKEEYEHVTIGICFCCKKPPSILINGVLRNKPMKINKGNLDRFNAIAGCEQCEGGSRILGSAIDYMRHAVKIRDNMISKGLWK